MDDIRIAAVIMRSPLGALEENLERTDRWAAEAGRQGARIVCFPELNLSGYATRPAMRQWAQPVPGPASRHLQAMARKHDLWLLAGLAEEDAAGRLFAAHLVVPPAGDPLIYRKLHTAPPEKGLFHPGNEVPLFRLGKVCFGVQLCYDAHFPELTTRMALAGADLVFFPHASPRGTPQAKLQSWMRHLPARAFDNGIFVVACNQAGDNGAGLVFPGMGVCWGPDGGLLATALSGEEGLLVVDLKAADLARVREHPMRYFLPHRRPELYDRPGDTRPTEGGGEKGLSPES
jgi:predicted amidohydrolase